MRLQEIMTTEVVTIGPDEAASTAWSRMERERVRHLVVTEGKRLLGVLSERDLGGRWGGAVRRGRTVRDLMTSQVAVATPETTLRQAANLMRGRLVGSLPVVDDRRVIGIVTATDVLEELGRGSSWPAVRAKRQAMRLPPASARAAKREGARKREPQAAKRAKRGRKSPEEFWRSRKQRSGIRPRVCNYRRHHTWAGPEAIASAGQPPGHTAASSGGAGGQAEGRPHRRCPNARLRPLGRVAARYRSQGLPAAQARPQTWQVRVLHRAHERAGRGCEQSARRS